MGYISTIVNLLDGLFDLTLKGATVRAARRHLTEYGYSGVRKQHGGIQYDIPLRHCTISVWLYKDELGSAIRPMSADSRVYQHKTVTDELVVGGSIRSEVDRQISLVVEQYPAALRGDSGDWPLENG